MADIKNVTDYLTPVELLAQLAEEGAELAQAALKLRRAYDGTNPTPWVNAWTTFRKKLQMCCCPFAFTVKRITLILRTFLTEWMKS